MARSLSAAYYVVSRVSILSEWPLSSNKDDVAFVWTEEMTVQMESTKRLLCGDVFVQPYDTILIPTIYADGSILNGAGYILVQQDGRFFSADDLKNKTNITEVTVNGIVCFDQVNDETDITMSKGWGWFFWNKNNRLYSSR